MKHRTEPLTFWKLIAQYTHTHLTWVPVAAFLERLSTKSRSVFMGIYEHFSRSAFVRSDTEVLPRSPPSNYSKRSRLYRVRDQDSVQTHFTHGFMDLTPNCSHKVRNMKLSEVPQYAGALTVPFTRKCRAQLLRNQTPPLCQTLYLAQRSQTTTVLLGNRQTQTRALHCWTAKRTPSLQRSCPHRSRVQWAVSFTWLHLTFCITLGDARLGYSCVAVEKPIPRSFLCTVLELTWRPHIV